MNTGESILITEEDWRKIVFLPKRRLKVGTHFFFSSGFTCLASAFAEGDMKSVFLIEKIFLYDKCIFCMKMIFLV